MYRFIPLIALLFAGTVFATNWGPLSDGDLRSSHLVNANTAVPQSRHAESEAVRFAWALDLDEQSVVASGPSVDSQAYWVDAKGAELARGLELPLSSAGAIIRISALDASARLNLDARALSVSLDGKTLSTGGADGLQMISGEELNAAGLLVPVNTLAFQLPEKGQPRSMQLQFANVPARQDFVIHVYEPDSAWRGELSAQRFQYLSGNELSLDVGLASPRGRVAADSVQAVLVSPNARHAWPLKLSADGMQLRGIAPDQLMDAGEGLWEVHAYLEGRQGEVLVRRDLKLALSVSAPTARLGQRIGTRLDDGLMIDLEVEVAAAGRYQASAQIWGMGRDGRMAPLAIAETATMLKPGRGALTLEVPARLLAASGLGEPFEARNVRLLDQGRMGLLELRQQGFTMDFAGTGNRMK